MILALLPFPVYWLVSFWTWMRVDEESRVAAWRIRSEIADRYEEPGPREGWYPALVYDLERLRRRDSYEAPAIN